MSFGEYPMLLAATQAGTGSAGRLPDELVDIQSRNLYKTRSWESRQRAKVSQEIGSVENDTGHSSSDHQEIDRRCRESDELPARPAKKEPRNRSLDPSGRTGRHLDLFG